MSATASGTRREGLLAGPQPVTAVVLNWNRRDDTLACLDSLAAQRGTALAAVVVDNGSSDGSSAAVRRRHPQVRVIETGENLGYAEGNNVGVRAALEERAQYVLVLNNDTVLAPDCVRTLLDDASAHPEAAAVGPKVYWGREGRRLYCCGGSFDWRGQPRMTGYGEPDGPRFEAAGETAWLNGCALLFRRRSLLDVGLFDPRFFLLFEETDWCVRARRAGLVLRVVPKARVWHVASSSFGSSRSPLYVYYYTRNHLLWVEKTARSWQRPVHYYGAVRRALRTTVRSLRADPAQARATRRAVARGLADYWHRRFGRADWVEA